MALKSIVLTVGLFLVPSMLTPIQASSHPEPTLLNVRGVRVMNLYGTQAEMAAQHGAFVRGHLDETALPFFARKIDNAIAQSYIMKDFPELVGPARGAIDALVGLPLREKLGREERAVLAAFAKASGFDRLDTLKAFTIPDVGQWLVTSIFQGNKAVTSIFGEADSFGCSSAILPLSSGLIHARNLDYESYRIFDRNPTVIFFHPDQGQDYVGVTSFGLHTAGITGTNASGLSLDLHQTFVAPASQLGTPIVLVTERVLREARTLDEAIAMLQSARYAGSWAVVLSSARERRAAVVEVSSEGTFVREMTGDHLVMTNHVFGDAMVAKQFAIDYKFLEDSRLRYSVLDKTATQLMSRESSVRAQDAVDLISSGPVALMNNIQSVVMMPTQGLIYVAVPTVEGAKPLDGRYVAIPLSGNVDKDGRPESADLARDNRHSKAEVEGTALHREAGQIATEDGRYADAADLLERAAGLDPRNHDYPLAAAMARLRAAPTLVDRNVARQQLDVASRDLDAAGKIGLSHYEHSLVELLRGRIADLAGDRKAALEHYVQVDQALSKPLTSAARNGLKRRYTLHRLRTLVVDYERVDLLRF